MNLREAAKAYSEMAYEEDHEEEVLKLLYYFYGPKVFTELMETGHFSKQD